MFGLEWAPGRLEALLASQRPREEVSQLPTFIDEAYKKEGVAQESQMNQRDDLLRAISDKYAPILRQQCEQMGMNVKGIEADLRKLGDSGDSEELQRYMGALREKYGDLIQEAMRQISLDPKEIANALLAQRQYPESAEVVQDDFATLFLDNSNELSKDKEQQKGP